MQKSVLTTLLSYLTQPAGVTAVSKPSIGTAYLYSVLIFVFPLIGAIALVHSNRVAIQVQIRLRAQLTSAVYLKALRLSSRCSSQRAAVEPVYFPAAGHTADQCMFGYTMPAGSAATVMLSFLTRCQCCTLCCCLTA